MKRTWRTLGPKKSTRKVIAMDRSPYKTAITFKQKAVCRSVNAVKEKCNILTCNVRCKKLSHIRYQFGVLKVFRDLGQKEF